MATNTQSNALPYVKHGPLIKPQTIANQAAVAVEKNTLLPNLLFKRQGFEDFKGQKDDSVTVRVEGVVGWREYALRNDRSAPIEYDQYAETAYTITLGDRLYNALALTDEEKDFDFNSSWAKLVAKQGEGLGRGLDFKAGAYALDAANYDLTLGVAEGSSIRSALIRARRVAGQINMPGARRKLLVSPAFYEAILNDKDLTLAQNVGDDRADSAVGEAYVGTLLGFDVFEVTDGLPDGEAIVAGESPFVFAQAASSVPQSVKLGALGSYKGYSVRLVQQYRADYMQDHSVLDALYGFTTVRDPLLVTSTAGQPSVSKGRYQVRAFRIAMGEAGSVGTGAGGTETEFKNATGVDAALLTVTPATEPAPTTDGGTTTG